MHPRTASPLRKLAALVLAGVISLGALIAWSVHAEELDKRILDSEAKRVAVVEKVKPAVVAVFSAGGQGGGSGVIISKDGFALTNFHVVEGAGTLMQCGLADGVLYDAALVGLDKVGDVALIKLVPQKEGKDFPFVALGDSDKVKAGDWSLAMGNPFLLATDFNPTVTFGLVSGVHRYQYPAGTLLEYTDCIQIDTSINPGNSGGPLFNMDGELIGINGRGSFEKRGRVNSGVGYAISINQIKNFLGHLKAGLDTDHATLGASVESDSEGGEGTSTKLMVKDLIEDSDCHRRGLDEKDELVSFVGRPMTSVNQFKNVLGLYPKGWRVPLVYRRNNDKHEILVRLMQLQRTPQSDDPAKPKPKPGAPRPAPPPRKSAASGIFEPKPGFANYYFNKVEQNRLLTAFRAHGDFSHVAGDWTFDAEAETTKKIPVKVAIREELEDKDKNGKPVVRDWTYHLKPESLPEVPAANPQTDQTPLRQAVRKAADLLRKHARSFSQEFWAQDTDEILRSQVIEMQKDVATIRGSLQDALDDLTKAGKDKAQEKVQLWQALYDYYLARLTAFSAYVDEYNFMLGQLRKELPPRDPKIHRGWRMVAEEKVQSGLDTRKVVAEAAKVWDKMLTDYKGTKFEELAKRDKAVKVGLKWQPTGGTKTMVHVNLGNVKYDLDPLKSDQNIDVLKAPKESGGLLTALYLYRRFLILGASGFEGHLSHGGHEPFYPPSTDGQGKSFKDLRIDTEVLHTEHAAVFTKWYFSLKDQTLVGFEVYVDRDEDPCEVYLSNYKMVDGRMLPQRMEVVHGNSRFAVFNISNYQLAAAR